MVWVLVVKRERESLKKRVFECLEVTSGGDGGGYGGRREKEGIKTQLIENYTILGNKFETIPFW